MNSNTAGRSTAEDGELEDGEICDDETEERAPPRRGEGRRPRGGARPRPRKPHQSHNSLRPLLGPPPQDFRHMMPYNPGPHLHGPFPPNLRQPDRPPAPPPPGMPLPPPPGLGLHGETNNRSNFWERSHGALGRFRHRVLPNGGRGSWNRGRGLGGNNRGGPGRPGPVDIHGSPSRKQKQPPRVRVRKVGPNTTRPDPSMNESFEDLLSKYKQIQLELDCIRKAETMALEPAASPAAEDVPAAASPAEARLAPEPTPELPLGPVGDLKEQLEKDEKKAFQAFNIKPLRHKLPTPAELDELRRKLEGQDGGGAEPGSSEAAEPEENVAAAAEEKHSASCGEETSQEERQDAILCRSESSASSEGSTVSSDKPVEKLEEEELSELQLRLLALQSASKKWQQQEQQVMKKSKDRIVKATQEKNSVPGSGAAPPDRQRVTTRSASSAAAAAAAAAAEQSRSRSKPSDRDRTKSGARAADRDRLRQSPKPGPRVPAERSRTPGKAHGTKRLISPGSSAKQAVRKQQLRNWKLQQQRKQEEIRRQEEEDRRKREEEIRRIRDLSNQDEQYNRFMKLVGGKRTRSRSRDQDHRKSAGKPGLDTSGSLYQYDNYDEVAMDTDSETSSPVPSPMHNLLPADETACFPPLGFYGAEAAAYGMDFSQAFLSPSLSGIPPPPPPLPPPPDDLEPPPKPPFADEEEEEEMLLRETCLMSMANKRVAAAEKSSSGPPSPTCPPTAEVQLPPRGNLSTVSLNTVPPSRSSRFSRAHPAARGPLVLPRHKSVVVSLKDSDDSDSDMDACSSSQTVFGGLEFMIKEVRRTVEATKPKMASGCEKENNPVRTPESLSEAKKAEYRILKEEIASREKQKMLKDHGSPAASEHVLESSSKPAAELRLSETEQKLNKHRELLQRDEAVLRHLLQQELKKTETLRAAETKVVKLREQLQASEKIVAANRTLLKKLQEQVQRVEQRVSLKKTSAVRLEHELMQAQLAAGRGSKRPTESSQTVPSKLQRLDAAPRGSERHFAELIAQKRRLQQLESEYALKIQKLKEAQARRNKAVPAEPPPPASVPPPAPQSQHLPPSSPFHLPQPSLHDLSQDKLVLDSEDIPGSFSSSMEQHYNRPENQTLNKDLWNGLDQPGHLRFSSPDLFNTKQFQQQATEDKTSYLTWSESKKRSRSKSAPRLKATLTPVPISVSPPLARNGRDGSQAASDSMRTAETQRESTSRPFLNEVHPIKLQPHSPLYVSDCFEQDKTEKPAVSPHVRCRVDIKPDAAVLEHTSRQIPNTHGEHLWQRYSQASSRSGLYVPRHIASSPTPTPSECYSGDFRQGYLYTTSMSPISYQHLDTHRMPSPTTPYLSQEHRAYSNPNIPTKFFYTEDAVRYPVHPYARTYFQDDRSSLTSFGSTTPSQYDPRTRWVHTLPVRSYYTDHLTNREPAHSVYNRPYSTTERGSYFSQTPLSRAYYGDDSRFTPYHMSNSRLFYSKPFSSPEEQYFPPRLYNTEGYRRPRMSQAFSDDWYRSSISGFSSHSSQNTPPRVRQDLSIPPWFTNSYTEASRLGADAKNHSKSWDNIIYPQHEREQTVPRGRSYENLFHQARQGTSSDVTTKPVILNLSSSPRRYAALSLSENSLERNSNKPWRNSKSGNWFVTPEITITDNDLCAGNARRRDVHSVSWDTSDGEKASAQRLLNEKKQSNTTEITKERKHNNFSLQQSLEQLDELLADLVVDYKPPTSKKSNENLLDQLKQLITEDSDKNTESPGLENLECLSTQLPSSKSSPDTLKDPDSGCDAFQRSAEECSPDHSTDEDDTMACANKKCNRIESMFNACLYFKSCHSCYTFYCSRNCRRDDWEIHKETCLYGRVSSVCRHTLKFCRENSEIHKAFSRIAKAGYLSRGRGVLFLGFANPDTAENFLQVGLESLLMSPTYLSLRELDGFKDNLGEYCKELQQAGNEYNPNECFLLNVSVAVGELVPNRPSPRVPAPTVRKYAKVSLASSSPDKKVLKKDDEMETLILTPPPGTPDIDKEGEEGRKAREVCFVNIQRELRTRGVFLRHEYPKIYNQLCEFVESNKRFTPTTIYPIDKRTGKQFMCMIMAASEPRTLDWLGTPHLLDDII